MKFYAAIFTLLAMLCLSVADYFAAERTEQMDEELEKIDSKLWEEAESAALRRRIWLGALRLDHTCEPHHQPVRLRLL